MISKLCWFPSYLEAFLKGNFKPQISKVLKVSNTVPTQIKGAPIIQKFLLEQGVLASLLRVNWPKSKN